MKKRGKFLINPLPFAAIVANPNGKKKARRKNPRPAAKQKAGIFVSKLPAKNPAGSNGVPIGPYLGYPRNMLGSGYNCPALKLFGYRTESQLNRAISKAAKPAPAKNPMKTRRKSKRRNPLSNLGRFAKKKSTRRRNPRRKAKRKISRPAFSRNPMSKKTRRRGSRRRTRNPISRRGARRSGRRSSARRMRNPLPMVKELFGPDILAAAGGAIGGSVLANTLIDRLARGDATGARSFDLPFVDYSMLAHPDASVKLTFWSKNSWILALYKLVAAGGAGWLIKKYSPRTGAGVMVGGMIAAINTVLQAQGVITMAGTLATTRGTGRYLNGGNRGAGAYTPGVPAIYTGPASAFIGGGVPNAGRGTGALVNRNFMQTAERAAPNPFGVS